MADLKYDTEQLAQSASKYREAAEIMNSVKQDLKTKVAALKDVHWQSTAGEAFMAMYQDTWAESVDKYVAVLNKMAELLDRAVQDYDSVTDKLIILQQSF